MITRKIIILKSYRQALLEIKKIQISNELSKAVENKFPSYNKSKQKVLTLFR